MNLAATNTAKKMKIQARLQAFDRVNDVKTNARKKIFERGKEHIY